MNGIEVKISPSRSFRRANDVDGEIEFFTPKLSVFDFDARLPLNLQRTDLTSAEFPFQKDLNESIYSDFIAFFLVNGPRHPITNTNVFSWYFQYHYDGMREPRFRIEDQELLWYSTTEGFGLNNYWGFKIVRCGFTGTTSEEPL
ncbi:MAG: hypothetical protein QM730_06700 [Anaerolineales bacterium]